MSLLRLHDGHGRQPLLSLLRNPPISPSHHHLSLCLLLLNSLGLRRLLLLYLVPLHRHVINLTPGRILALLHLPQVLLSHRRDPLTLCLVLVLRKITSLIPGRTLVGRTLHIVVPHTMIGQHTLMMTELKDLIDQICLHNAISIMTATIADGMTDRIIEGMTDADEHAIVS